MTTQGKMRFFEGATKEQIVTFENENDIKLPKQYKEWLEFSGGGDFFLPAGVQLYGVTHKPMIDVNENNRPNEKYVVIGALASGDPVLCKKEGEQIVIYNIETGKIEEDDWWYHQSFLYYMKIC